MKHRIRSFLAALLLSALTAGATAAQTRPIERHIDLGAHGRIELGAPFTADSIATRRPGGFYGLRPGTFSGADSIGVLLIDDRVGAIRFSYAPVAADFATYVANGTSAFGAPERWTEEAEGGGRIEYAVWKDEATAMELRLAVQGEQVELTAMLADRRLMGP